jgi:hypothetical protein
MHAFSALLLALIARQWFSQITAIVCTMPMIASPYMMLWFSQINKESFAPKWCFGNHTWGFANTTKIQSSLAQIELGLASFDTDWIMFRVAGALLRKSANFLRRSGHFFLTRRFQVRSATSRR